MKWLNNHFQVYSHSKLYIRWQMIATRFSAIGSSGLGDYCSWNPDCRDPFSECRPEPQSESFRCGCKNYYVIVEGLCTPGTGQLCVNIIAWAIASYLTLCDTVKPVCNDHLYNKIYNLGFIQKCVLMKTEGINLHLLTISAFWSPSRWPLAT